ncbi:MAG: LytTR family DNA-binding domain-containing protein [Burkholderiaceae bacterium]
MQAHPTALVAEDEMVLGDELCMHLSELWPELRILARAVTGLEALHLIERHRPDVLFLDIEMPGLTGIEVARQAHASAHIVFITAYDSHAVEAFEQGAIDYVLKPYDPRRLAESVRRLQQRMTQAAPALEGVLRELAAAARPRDHLRWINASSGQEVKLITVDEVCYFRSDAKYTVVVTADGEALIRKPLKELVERLDPAQFWQVHRSTIVNASEIASVGRTFRGRLYLKLKHRDETLPVSEAHESLFRQM